MKKLQVLFFAVALLAAGTLTTSCTYNSRAMSNSNAHLQLESDDVTISESMSASAKETKIFGIDWKRLFKKEVGMYGRGAALSIPIIGTTPTSRAQGYAIYKLLKANPEYDAVMYPMFEGTSKNILGIVVTTDVTVKAKLVKVKTN